MNVLVYGRGKTGDALQRWAERSDVGVTFVDDNSQPPSDDELASLLDRADCLVPNPAVPEHHRVFAMAAERDVFIVSEIELAWRELDALGCELIAITGTNGKTTVTTLVERMLRAAGVSAIAAGNIGHPLVDAVMDGVDVVVAEVSSFQLRFIEHFRPKVAVLLNVAEDHLDWHGSFDAYVAAKARIMENQRFPDTFVFNEDDPVVAEVSKHAPSQALGFSLGSERGSYCVTDGYLVNDMGKRIIAVDELPRALPYDIANALAAAAACNCVGVRGEAVADVLREFRGLPHRATLVRQSGGVRFYDDSKATNPHATVAALRAFDSVVLIAGGRNKGNDLSVLRDEAVRIRSVVALGESAPAVEAAFRGLRPVIRVASMHDAVQVAAGAAQPGDVVLLSPACASWDMYNNYGERGDDFAAEVAALIGTEEAG